MSLIISPHFFQKSKTAENRLGNRLGDNAKTCFIELVDFNEAMLEAKAQEAGAAKKATRRTRRSSKKAAPAAEEAPKAEE